MLSSDKNVDALTHLLDVIAHYLGLRVEYTKLTIIAKSVKLISAAILAFVMLLLTAGIILCLSVGAAYWIATTFGVIQASLTLAGIYLIAMIIVYLGRKVFFERPIVRFLTKLLLEKN